MNPLVLAKLSDNVMVCKKCPRTRTLNSWASENLFSENCHWFYDYSLGTITLTLLIWKPLLLAAWLLTCNIPLRFVFYQFIFAFTYASMFLTFPLRRRKQSFTSFVCHIIDMMQSPPDFFPTSVYLVDTLFPVYRDRAEECSQGLPFI